MEGIDRTADLDAWGRCFSDTAQHLHNIGREYGGPFCGQGGGRVDDEGDSYHVVGRHQNCRSLKKAFDSSLASALQPNNALLNSLSSTLLSVLSLVRHNDQGLSNDQSHREGSPYYPVTTAPLTPSRTALDAVARPGLSV